MPIECLKDCQALCCRKGPFILTFGFSQDEVKMLETAGAKLRPDLYNTGFIMETDCPFLENNKCRLHNTPQQPQCCSDNHAGGQLCLKIRQCVLNSKRFSQIE